jgi:hypothetical protein
MKTPPLLVCLTAIGPGDALATAYLLFDCLILIRTPHLYQQEGRELNEKRIREMVRFLGRSLK